MGVVDCVSNQHKGMIVEAKHPEQLEGFLNLQFHLHMARANNQPMFYLVLQLHLGTLPLCAEMKLHCW